MSGLPLISRRRLLTAMALSPLLWQMNTAHAAAIDPNRIVALEWLPVELLLALGIVPYGVADTINYRLWVSEPPLPDSVIDVGLRTEPNLELLTEMKPSFMVWSAGYGPSSEMLARIAPGRGFNFSDGKQPLAMARKSLTEMADLLNLQSAAETHLAQYEDFILSMKPRFVKRGARPLLLTTLIDPRHMLVFGPNSLFGKFSMSTASQMRQGKPTSGAVPPSVSIVWRRIKTLMCSVLITTTAKTWMR